jgi:hypothetical protein
VLHAGDAGPRSLAVGSAARANSQSCFPRPRRGVAENSLNQFHMFHQYEPRKD